MDLSAGLFRAHHWFANNDHCHATLRMVHANTYPVYVYKKLGRIYFTGEIVFYILSITRSSIIITVVKGMCIFDALTV